MSEYSAPEENDLGLSPEERIGVAPEQPLVIPVIREELTVGKRQITTGSVQIRKVIHDEEQLIEERLVGNQVDVERVAVNRVVDGPVPVRYEGETAVYSVIEEILVVTKQFVVKEEVRITHRLSESYDRRRVTLRTEDLLVERSSPPEPDQS